VNFNDIINGIEEGLPILATLAGHPEVGVLGTKLISIIDGEISRRMNKTGQSRSEVLADAATTFAAAKQANVDLKKLGHEADG
jgi:hypothetical protein